MIIIDADTMLYRVGFSNPPSVDSAIQQLDKYVSGVINTAQDIYNIEDYVLCLTISDGSRYRDQFCTTFEYKGNRKNNVAPKFMNEMASFLITQFKCQITASSDGEADDTVASLAYKLRNEGKPYVVVGVDKDLDQIAGNHYNFVTGVDYEVTQDEADKFFFKQLLTGDTADGIPGLYSIGPKRADKLLAHGKNPLEWWDIVVNTYTKMYHNTWNTQEELDELVSKTLFERGNALWIRRNEGEIWSPPIPGYSQDSGTIPF